MKASRKTLLLALALGATCAAFAADIGLRHDPAGETITLTNHLDRTIYLMDLLADGLARPILLELQAGQSGALPMTGALPLALAARGVLLDSEALTGHVANGDGSYEFSIAIE